ncbi:MBL fold metallo-hydrolase [Brevibacillus migulae]|uniref:MBL fold metallo-hydrolase n=1 Tax=Brevibacillus migulae TaxID=1644114 RepID=UPI00106E0E58|nr:MBL fold metallo-hydrolase [Brevibacillus migulae]
MNIDPAALQAMTPHELTRIVFNKESLFILDVRNESDFANWKVEGENIDVINIPYFDLIDGIDQALHQIPEGRKVLVVCAKEGSSIFVAKQLLEAGRLDVSYLHGGMKGWSQHLEPVKVGDLKDGGELYQFVRIGKGCLSYMVVSNGEAAVVDTLRMTAIYEDFAKTRNVKITNTIDTHLHADHISGGKRLADHTGATYWLPPKDAAEVTFSYEGLEEGKEIRVGSSKISIQPIYSPGHTMGSTSLIVDDTYFLTGDVLFVGSIGRPDLAGKAEDWVDDLRDTLYNRFKELSEDLIVLPAHFGNITELKMDGSVSARLGELYQHNPGLCLEDEDQFRIAVTENLPPQPNAYQDIRQVNMGKLSPNEEEQQDMEMGPNRCAVHEK